MILPILTTLLVHLVLHGWGNVVFELGSERVNESKRVSPVHDIKYFGQYAWYTLLTPRKHTDFHLFPAVEVLYVHHQLHRVGDLRRCIHISPTRMRLQAALPARSSGFFAVLRMAQPGSIFQEVSFARKGKGFQRDIFYHVAAAHVAPNSVVWTHVSAGNLASRDKCE